MKRVILLILVALLALPALAEPAPQTEAAVSEELVAGYSAQAVQSAVEAYLDSINWQYDVEDGIIMFALVLEGEIPALQFEMRFFESGFTAYAYPGLNAEAERMAAVGEFLHRANFGLRSGNFEIDYEDGQIRYKTNVDCMDALPRENAIARTITVPANMFERYDEALLKVLVGELEPEAAMDLTAE